MDQPNKEELIEKWLAGDLTDAELLESISQEELNQYKTILNTVDNWEPEGADAIKDKLNLIFSTPKEAKVVSMNRRNWIVGIAASISMLAIVSYLLLFSPKESYYAENGPMELTLPDKTTKVILSEGARITYDKFDDQNREVTIEGRVYFDVTQKGSFKVNYDEGQISVLGTQFEVVNLGDYFEATCFEGLVEVNHRGKRARAGVKDRVAYLKGGLVKSKTNQSKPGWVDQDGESFDNASLEKVVKVIEQRYKVEVDEGDVSLDRRYTGSIPIDNLDQACRKVFSTLGIQYRIQDDRVFLSE